VPGPGRQGTGSGVWWQGTGVVSREGPGVRNLSVQEGVAAQKKPVCGVQARVVCKKGGVTGSVEHEPVRRQDTVLESGQAECWVWHVEPM